MLAEWKGFRSYSSSSQVYIHITDNTPGDKKNGILALFSHKMAFLKSKFKDDPVRVQRHTVRHFKDLE